MGEGGDPCHHEKKIPKTMVGPGMQCESPVPDPAGVWGSPGAGLTSPCLIQCFCREGDEAVTTLLSCGQLLGEEAWKEAGGASPRHGEDRRLKQDCRMLTESQLFCETRNCCVWLVLGSQAWSPWCPQGAGSLSSSHHGPRCHWALPPYRHAADSCPASGLWVPQAWSAWLLACLS